MYAPACIRARMYACIRTHTFACICTYTHAYVCTPAFTHIHIHTHTYVHEVPYTSYARTHIYGGVLTRTLIYKLCTQTHTLTHLCTPSRVSYARTHTLLYKLRTHTYACTRILTYTNARARNKQTVKHAPPLQPNYIYII